MKKLICIGENKPKTHREKGKMTTFDRTLLEGIDPTQISKNSWRYTLNTQKQVLIGKGIYLFVKKMPLKTNKLKIICRTK